MLPQYLLESSICLALFYAFYQGALRRQTFFQLNRWYLLLMPVLALLIPLAEWEWTAPEPPPVVEYVLPVWTEWRAVDYSVQATMAQPAPGMQVQLNDLLLAVYAAGVFFLFLQLLRRLLSVYRLIWRGSKRYKAEYILIETQEEIPAASFFSYVFWRGTDSELDEVVLAHESVHVRQRHSLDVLLMECMVMLLWFNPLIYLFRNQLRETHEYIADAYVSRRLGSAHQYARHLLAQRHPTVTYSLTHSFAAMLPKRLKMLGRKRSAFWRYFNYLFVIPMIGIMIILFAYNFSGKLSPELADRLEAAQSKLNRLGNTTIYAGHSAETDMQLGWSDNTCKCYPGQFPTFYYCENVYLSVSQFKRLIKDDQWFSLSENGKEVKYEIKTMTSKRQLKLGGGFLDKTTIKRPSNFWMDVERGDVLHIAAQSESGKWTEFNVLINPKGELVFPFYDVYIGDLRIPIEINNMTAAKHVDRATFESFREAKIRLLKNGKEWVRFWPGSRERTYRETKVKKRDTEFAAVDFMPDRNRLDVQQNSIRLKFSLPDGEDLSVTLLVTQGLEGKKDAGRREVTIHWGDLELPYEGGIHMLCKNIWKERLQQPLRIFVNGQERKIVDYGELTVLDRMDIKTYHKQRGTPLSSMEDLSRLTLRAFEATGWEPTKFVMIKDLETDRGEQFGLAIHSAGQEDCQTDPAQFLSSYRRFRSSSDFVFNYDLSQSGMEPLIWDPMFKNGRLFLADGEAAFLVDGKWLNKEELDEVDLAAIRSLTLLKPSYAKQQYGEQGANGVVVLETD